MGLAFHLSERFKEIDFVKILAPPSGNRNQRDSSPSIPDHVLDRWRRFNALIDEALAADVSPWFVAEAACAAIAREWVL
jgi:hypothetical protein